MPRCAVALTPSMFQPATSTTDTGGQTFLASRPAADTVPSQVPFTASYSDDLFAPVTGSHSQFQPYILPNVPDFPYHRRNKQHSPTIPHPFPHNNYHLVHNVQFPFLP